jgi:hypothetical protein
MNIDIAGELIAVEYLLAQSGKGDLRAAIQNAASGVALPEEDVQEG